MQNNTGLLLMVGLGALLFMGRGARQNGAEETVADTAPTTIGAVTPRSDDTATIVVGVTEVQIGGGEIVTETELAVRRSEQVKKQVFASSAGVVPSAPALAVSQGDVDAIALDAGTFAYGGAPRPTSTAMPVWNNRYGWYWKNPIGGAVGPGGKEWTPGDTSTNMGSPGTNIGPVLPPGWTPNRGGSANFTGIIEHDFGLA